MRIRLGTVKKDVTAFGNKYWVQIEDTKGNDNESFRDLVGKQVVLVVEELCLTSVKDVEDIG